MIVFYDFEVFSDDWLVVFKRDGTHIPIWNDAEALKAEMYTEDIYVGFNCKHYDMHILRAVAAGFSNHEIKKLNDYLIQGGQGWMYPELQSIYYPFATCDIKDDMSIGLSLKAIEGHLGQSIVESSVPFDIDRPLTQAERDEVQRYCMYDVDTTEKIYHLRQSYLNNKIALGNLAGITPAEALGKTNAKLTATMLRAEKKTYTDERDYYYPDNLLREYIPSAVFDFFDELHNDSIDDEDVFVSKLTYMLGDCEVTLGYGGIHGAIRTYEFTATDTRIIKNYDVGSYYPHLMTINGYCSRSIPSPKVFEDVLAKRMKAKAEGDTKTADALKLVCNTTYGAMLDRYNPLYDPLMGRSVCISGQLYLLELAEHLYREVDTLKIIQLNTDGIMIEVDRAHLADVQAICDEWQKRTGFTLEDDTIKRLVQKDVNNYLEVQDNDKVKCKGLYLVRGISDKGAFNINNTAPIVATAIKEYFIADTAVEDTINSCTNILDFQFIAKASSSYARVYQLVDGIARDVQHCNRVYATKDERYGTLIKVKRSDYTEAKIADLPEHCIIDNDNTLSIDEIDREYYIQVALKKINDFKGGTQKMATTKATEKEKVAMNVWQKLILARKMFLEKNVEKTGKHNQMAFKYFELDDIVPPITEIFNEIGLVSILSFMEGNALLTIRNTDNAEERIDFVVPCNPYDTVYEGQKHVAIQALGAGITYIRRYMYLIALDICVPDELDPVTPIDEKKTVKSKIPATPQERAEVKKQIVKTEENASDLQLKGLKTVLKKLKEKDPSKEVMIEKIAKETSGFTVITKEDCEKLIEKITEMIGE